MFLLLCISFSYGVTLNLTFSCDKLYDTKTNLTKQVTGLGDYHFNHAMISYRDNDCLPSFVTDYDLIAFSSSAVTSNASLGFKNNNLIMNFYSSGSGDLNLAIAIKLNSTYKATNDSVFWDKYYYNHGTVGENNKFVAFYLNGVMVGGTIKTLSSSGVTGSRDFNDSLASSINSSWSVPFIFDEIVFTDAGLGGTYLNISNLVLSTVTEYGNNNYPEVNVTFSKACVNSTSDSTTLDYQVSSYDQEGDTVLTSDYLRDNSYYSKNLKKTISFNQRAGGLLFPSYQPNYNDLQQWFINGSCKINTEQVTDQDHVLYWLNIKDYSGNYDKYMLNLNSQCSGFPVYVYDLKYSLDNIAYSSQIYSLDTVNESFNLTFYDNSYSEVLKMKFLVFNATHTKVYTWNGSGFVTLFSVLNQEKHDFIIQTWGKNSSYAPSFTYINSNQVFNLNYTSKEPVQYVEYTFTGNFYQDGFYYSGNAANITLSTLGSLVSSGSKVAYYGYYDFTIYYTDNVHTPLYQSKNFSGFIDLCEYTSEVNTETNMSKVFKPGNFFDSLLGKPLRSYMSVQDKQNIGRTVLWYLFFLMVIFFMVGGYLVTHHIDVIFPVLASSTLCAIVSGLMQYTDSLISYVIIGCLALSIPIATSLLGNHGGVTKNG